MGNQSNFLTSCFCLTKCAHVMVSLRHIKTRRYEKQNQKPITSYVLWHAITVVFLQVPLNVLLHSSPRVVLVQTSTQLIHNRPINRSLSWHDQRTCQATGVPYFLRNWKRFRSQLLCVCACVSVRERVCVRMCVGRIIYE